MTSKHQVHISNLMQWPYSAVQKKNFQLKSYSDTFIWLCWVLCNIGNFHIFIGCDVISIWNRLIGFEQFIIFEIIFRQKVCEHKEKNAKKPAKATYAIWRTFSKISGEHFPRSPEWRTISNFRHPENSIFCKVVKSQKKKGKIWQ